MRAALVPSSVLRTTLVGGACLACVVLLALPQLSAEQPAMGLWLGSLGAMFVVATVVTSRVIYGLRRAVRDARRLGRTVSA